MSEFADQAKAITTVSQRLLMNQAITWYQNNMSMPCIAAIAIPRLRLI